MANLPVVIFQFAMSPYEDWHKLAWAGALLITLSVLALTFLLAYSSETGQRHTEIMNAAVLQPVEQALTQKIQVKNLNFYYGKFQALKSINLNIPERKVTAFIGPSGCGKSTLLRTFNRMYALYPNQEAQGEILLDGRTFWVRTRI